MNNIMTREEMTLRIKRLERAILDLHYSHGIYVGGICHNNAAHNYPVAHPHYLDELRIDWMRPQIYLGTYPQ